MHCLILLLLLMPAAFRDVPGAPSGDINSPRDNSYGRPRSLSQGEVMREQNPPLINRRFGDIIEDRVIENRTQQPTPTPYAEDPAYGERAGEFGKDDLSGKKDPDAEKNITEF